MRAAAQGALPPALSFARAAGAAGHHRLAAARSARVLRHRRSALHFRMGPRVPPRVPAAELAAASTFPDKPIAAFTASATQRVRHDILAAASAARAAQVHRQLSSRQSALRGASVRQGHAPQAAAGGGARLSEGESVIVYAPTIATVEQTVDFLDERSGSPPCLSRPDGHRDAPPQSGALDERRSPRAGGHDRLRTGHQQAGGARGDPHVAAEIDRAVLPGGGPRGPRRSAGRLRRCSGSRRMRGCSRTSSTSCSDPDEKAARLGAVPHGARVRRERDAAAICRSARTSGRRRNGSAARCATSAATCPNG